MPNRSFEEIQEDIDQAYASNDAEAMLRYASELDELDTPPAEAMSLRSRGKVYDLRGDYTSAMSHYLRALVIHEELGDRKGVANVTGKIGSLYSNIGDDPEAHSCFQRALAIYEELGDRSGVAGTTCNIGLLHQNTGDYPTALEHYHRALALCEEIGHRHFAANITCNIGIVYKDTGDHPGALSHFKRALALYEELGDRRGEAGTISNIGLVYQSTGDYPAALEHYHRALALCEEIGHPHFAANITSNIGTVHASTGDYPNALSHYQRCLVLFEELGDRKGVASAIGNIGVMYKNTGDYPEALRHYHRALALYEELGDRNNVAIDTDNIISAYLDMGSDVEAQALLQTMDAMQIDEPGTRIHREHHRATLQERSGDLDGAAATLQRALAEALELGLRAEAAKTHKAFRDLALKQNDLAAYVEHNNEYTRINEEINGKDTATKLAMHAKQREIDAREKEHEKYMSVLHSTLPRNIAERVARGEVVNDHFENAAVLFMDVVGFTTHSSELDATVVVELLQSIFSSFDGICAKHDVTKIKTIGDSYMAVAFDIADAVGARPRLAREQTDIPNVMPSVVEAQQIANSEQRIANVALAMMSSEFTWPHTGERVMFRIGIHCGPVVAGVLGTERMQYDVWGDTVNVASRMESTSEPGRIQISDVLAQALNENKNSPPSPLSHASLERGSYTVIPRGTVDVKGKGMMQTYWLLMK